MHKSVTRPGIIRYALIRGNGSTGPRGFRRAREFCLPPHYSRQFLRFYLHYKSKICASDCLRKDGGKENNLYLAPAGEEAVGEGLSSWIEGLSKVIMGRAQGVSNDELSLNSPREKEACLRRKALMTTMRKWGENG